MSEADRAHTKENLIWQGKDYENKTVSLYVNERDHIINGHENELIADNFTAIYDSVEDPGSVYEGGNATNAHGNRKVFFKKSEVATYYPRFFTKTIVEYPNDESGFIVSAFVSKKEGGNVGKKIYP